MGRQRILSLHLNHQQQHVAPASHPGAPAASLMEVQRCVQAICMGFDAPRENALACTPPHHRPYWSSLPPQDPVCEESALQHHIRGGEECSLACMRATACRQQRSKRPQLGSDRATACSLQQRPLICSATPHPCHLTLACRCMRSLGAMAASARYACERGGSAVAELLCCGGERLRSCSV